MASDIGKTPDPFLQDEETAPLSEEEIARLRGGGEVLRELGLPVPRGRGRPPKEVRKKQVTLRLDPDIVERFRAGGRGWQTRINEALREWLQSHPSPRAKAEPGEGK